MIGSFESLLHLSIESSNRIALPYRLWNCLSKLTQLKTLKLKVPQVDEWMFWNGTSESEFATLYNQSSADSRAKTQLLSTMRPMATTFPNLETLLLAEKSAAFFRNEHVSLLPRSLTSLAVLVKKGSIDEGCFEYVASLPKLAKLHLIAHSCTKLSTPLPPSITLLSIEKSDNSILIEPSFWVGSTITDLSLPLDPASVAYLPPTITKLNVVGKNLSNLSFQHLPSLLSVRLASEGETLGFVIPTFSSPVEALDMVFRTSRNNFDLRTVLPTVKHLNINCGPQADLDNAFKYIQSFTQLVSLRLYTMIFESGHLHRLPPTLTSFEWNPLQRQIVKPSTDEDVAKLPRGLTSLDFQSFAVKLSSSAFQHLPPLLKSLTLCIELPTEPSDEEIAKHFQALPRSLRSLNIIPYVF